MSFLVPLQNMAKSPILDLNSDAEKYDNKERELQHLLYKILMLNKNITLLADRQNEIEEAISEIFQKDNTPFGYEENELAEYFHDCHMPNEISDDIFICPGHTDFFHRYQILSKAKKKASAEVMRKEKEYEIKEARYEIIKKDSPEGKNSVYFKGLNFIYKYAVNIIYHHHDDSKTCPFHPRHSETIYTVW